MATSPAREGQRSGGKVCSAAFSLCGWVRAVPDDIIPTEIGMGLSHKKGASIGARPFLLLCKAVVHPHSIRASRLTRAS